MMLRATTLTLLLVGVLLAGAGSSRAAVVASYATTGCPSSAPVWNVHLSLYWQDTHGNILNQAGLPAMEQAASSFAQQVGSLSQCAVGVHVDVDDMAAAVWPGGDPFDATGKAVGFADFPNPPAGYDAELTRIPGQTTGNGVASPALRSAVLPMTDTQAYAHMDLRLLHEWLHLVVGYYRTPLGWPIADVHGACSRTDYQPLADCLVNPQWFHDLMTGQVKEDGQDRGLPVTQWAFQGTPTHPLHKQPDLIVKSLRGRTLKFSTSFRGTAAVTLRNAVGKQVAWRKVAVKKSATTVKLPLLKPAQYQLCLVTPVTAALDTRIVCMQFVAVRPASLKRYLHRQSGATLRLQASGPLQRRPATLTWCATTCKAGQRTQKLTLRSLWSLRWPLIHGVPARSVTVRVAAFTRQNKDWRALKVIFRR